MTKLDVQCDGCAKSQADCRIWGVPVCVDCLSDWSKHLPSEDLSRRESARWTDHWLFFRRQETGRAVA